MQLTIAMQGFNEKLRQMNQSNGKQLVLTAQDARNLQSDIYALLGELTKVTTADSSRDDIVQVNMDGGTFRS